MKVDIPLNQKYKPKKRGCGCKRKTDASDDTKIDWTAKWQLAATSQPLKDKLKLNVSSKTIQYLLSGLFVFLGEGLQTSLWMYMTLFRTIDSVLVTLFSSKCWVGAVVAHPQKVYFGSYKWPLQDTGQVWMNEIFCVCNSILLFDAKRTSTKMQILCRFLKWCQ